MRKFKTGDEVYYRDMLGVITAVCSDGSYDIKLNPQDIDIVINRFYESGRPEEFMGKEEYESINGKD